MRPLHLILLGFVLSVAGVALPFSMLIQILPSTFPLNFLAFLSSISGLILGIIGAASYVRGRRK